MDRKSSSRRYGVQAGAHLITLSDLDQIRYGARTVLLDQHGADPAVAWTTAVVAYLTSKGLLERVEPIDRPGEGM